MSHLVEEVIEDLDKISKIVMGGCPKINVITEIMAMKHKWELYKDVYPLLKEVKL